MVNAAKGFGFIARAKTAKMSLSISRRSRPLAIDPLRKEAR